MQSGILGRLALAVGLLVGTGCATHVSPGPGARLVEEGPGEGAVAEAEGVRLEARSRAWRWTPRTLDRELTPIFVELHNEDDRSLRVRYGDFAFVATEGDARFAALPPFEVKGEVTVPVQTAYRSPGFRVAPHLGSYYPNSLVYGGGFAYDDPYYADHHRRMAYRDVALPSDDMLSHALPEGVIEPGGRAAGFVYFERIEDAETRAFELRFELVDAEGEQPFGRLAIPFVVE